MVYFNYPIDLIAKEEPTVLKRESKKGGRKRKQRKPSARFRSQDPLVRYVKEPDIIILLHYLSCAHANRIGIGVIIMTSEISSYNISRQTNEGTILWLELNKPCYCRGAISRRSRSIAG